MADYCSISDVQVDLQRLTLTSSTDPSTTEVTTWCGQVTAEMNSRMNAVGITTPVTDSTKLDMLKAIAVDWVMWKILGSLNVESDAAQRRKTSYDNSMQRIEKNPSIIEETSVAYSAPDGAKASSRPFRRGSKDW